jgi:hypothetical protein
MVQGFRVADWMVLSGDNLRPIARQSLRYVLVGSALACAYRIDLRIGLIGLSQGFGQAFGLRGMGGKTEGKAHC